MAKAATARSRLARPARVLALPRRARELARLIAAEIGEHHLWTYASAIAYRALVALVPLVLLGLGLLRAFGLEDVWSNSVAPAVQAHVTPPVYAAIDYSVEKIFASSVAPLIAFSAALLLWDMTWAMTTSMEALNEIHDVEEPRRWWWRYLVAVALAGATILCIVGAVLAVVLGPRPGGASHVVFGIGRWPLAVILLGLAIGFIVRYGPAEHPQARWASAGSVLIVGSWIVASIGFRWWVASVANFKTAIGSLTFFLVLTAYVFISAAIFLIGVQLDELLRTERK
jgi:membrane protein